MTYDELKEIDRLEAIKMVADLPPGYDLRENEINRFPLFPDVIVFGDDYWGDVEKMTEFIDTYVKPKSEKETSKFLNDIAKRTCLDPVMDCTETRNQLSAEYKLMYKSYIKLFNHPDSRGDWAEQKGTFIWFEHILPLKRKSQFLKIVKNQDDEKLKKISARIKQIYGFSDREIIYLQYFCSQSKSDTLDASLNTFLYIWSAEKFTGKTTVSEYICSFLNGESRRNAEPHKSTLSNEMQIGRFDIPLAATSRCTFLDEAGFHDMTKSYNKLKTMITSNSCVVEYKYKNSKRTKKCWRNYIMSSNDDPIYLIKDEDERRILPIKFTTPEQIGFDELERIWYEFVLECNLSDISLIKIYHEIIKPNSQHGESHLIARELMDLLNEKRVFDINGLTTPYFSVSNVMMFPEVITQKLTRKLVKEVLVKMYGEPDKSQRFYKRKRKKDIEGFEEEFIEIPF